VVELGEGLWKRLITRTHFAMIVYLEDDDKYFDYLYSVEDIQNGDAE